MKNAQLPSGLEYVRTTDEFDQENHPKGLHRAHHVAPRVWGRLVVRTGQLVFVFEDEEDSPIIAGAGDTVLIPPQRKHHVEFPDPVTFVIEFHRESEEPQPVEGEESTGLRND